MAKPVMQVMNLERLKALETWLQTTNTKLVRINGQRKYGGPPEVWDGPTPGAQCEVFISRIPREAYEDLLIPLFSSVAPLWEFRLMMNFSGQNRGFAFAKYGSATIAAEAIRQLDGYMLEPGYHLLVRLSIEKKRLCIGDLPATTSQEDLLQMLHLLAEGVESVSLKAGRGHASAVAAFSSHRAASMANKVLFEGFKKKFGMTVSVKWQPIKILGRDESRRPQKPAERLQPHLRPPRCTQNSPPPSGSPSGSSSGTPPARSKGSPRARPSGSPRARSSGSPPARPPGTPPARPLGSPRARSSGSPRARPSGSPPARPSGTPPASSSGAPPARSSGTPQARPSGSPPARPSGTPPALPSAPPSGSAPIPLPALPPAPSSAQSSAPPLGPPPGFSFSTVFCRAVRDPNAPQYHHPQPSYSTQEHLGYEASPVMLLHELCELIGIGQPFYEMQFSHAGPDGFIYFFYKVRIPGIAYVFKGLVTVLPGLSLSTMLEEAQKAAAQQVLQRFPA